MINISKLKQFYNLSRHLSPDDFQELLKSAQRKQFDKNERIILEGSTKNEVYFITSGLVRSYQINSRGDAISFVIYAEQSILSNIDFILFEQPSSFTFEALEKTVTYSMPYNLLQSIIDRNPQLEKNRKHLLRKIIKLQYSRNKSFVLCTPEERYLNFIEENPTLINRVPINYIAHILGITPVSLSRIRKRILTKKQ